MELESLIIIFQNGDILKYQPQKDEVSLIQIKKINTFTLRFPMKEP